MSGGDVIALRGAGAAPGNVGQEFGDTPFAEQILFFRNKLGSLLPSSTWSEIEREAHDRAFVVSGALQADLLTDLHAAVGDAIEQGQTLEEFQAEFDALAEKHGWAPWKSQAGRAWRAEIIYGTNLRTSYAAGRWAQMTGEIEAKPYWRYRHNDSVLHPRETHLAMNGIVMPADSDWWKKHYPPSGWNCKCYVENLSQQEMDDQGLEVGEPVADYEVDPGWDYAPGASVADELTGIIEEKVTTVQPEVAKGWLWSLVTRVAGDVWNSVRSFAETLLKKIGVK